MKILRLLSLLCICLTSAAFAEESFSFVYDNYRVTKKGREFAASQLVTYKNMPESVSYEMLSSSGAFSEKVFVQADLDGIFTEGERTVSQEGKTDSVTARLDDRQLVIDNGKDETKLKVGSGIPVLDGSFYLWAAQNSPDLEIKDDFNVINWDGKVTKLKLTAADEEITVPAGKFDCVRLSGQTGGTFGFMKSSVSYWFYKEAPYMLVKFTGEKGGPFGGADTELVLTEVKKPLPAAPKAAAPADNDAPTE